MAEEIGAKLKLTGETSYSKAMREAAKNTKNLGAELKLAEANFKASGNAQELMAQKGKILHEQLEQQKQAVEIAKEALSKFTSAEDQSSAKAIEWRAKLAQAEQQVLQLNAAIENNAQGLDEAGNAYDSLGESMQNAAMDAETAKVNLGQVAGSASGIQDTLEKIGQKFSWDGLSETLGGINEKIDSVISKAVEMGKAIWQAVVDASVWADDLITQSVVTGIDRETLQRWSYAARFVDTSVDTIVSARTKLLSNMVSNNTETAAEFNALHVATRNADGSIRSVDATFWDVIAALGRIENETQRDAIAMKLMGKNAKELNPLIEAGYETWQSYADSAPLISDDKIDALGETNDAIEDMNAWLEALKLDVLSELAPTITEIADAIRDAAKALKEYLDSDEGQQALTRLQGAISDLITDFTELDFGKILSDASSNITGIINGFSSILEQKDAIIGGLEAIGGAALFLKLAEAATNAMTLFTNLKLLKTVGGLGAGAAAAEAGAAAATGGASTAVGAAAGGVAGAIATKAATAAAGVVAKMPIFAAGYMGVTAILDQTETGRTLRDTGDLGKTLEAASEEVGNYVESVQENISTFGQDWANLWDAFKRDVFGISDTVTDAVDQTESNAEVSEERIQQLHSDLELLRGIAEGDLSAYAFDDLSPDLAERFPGSIFSMMMDHWGSAENWYDNNSFDDQIDDTAVRMANELIDALTDGVEDGGSDVGASLSDVVDTSFSTVEESIGTQPEIIGGNVSIGFANGINEKADVAISAASALANAVTSIMASALDIGSPSKVMEELGAFTGEGFAIGMAGTQDMISQATGQMLSGIDMRAPAPPEYGSRASGYEAYSMPGLILSALSQMVVQIDGQDAGKIMLPTMEELMADQMMSRRYEA